MLLDIYLSHTLNHVLDVGAHCTHSGQLLAETEPFLNAEGVFANLKITCMKLILLHYIKEYNTPSCMYSSEINPSHAKSI